MTTPINLKCVDKWETTSTLLISGKQLVRHTTFFSPLFSWHSEIKLSQWQSFKSHTKDLQVLTMLSTAAKWKGHWQKPGDKLLTPLSHFPSWESSPAGKHNSKQKAHHQEKALAKIEKEWWSSWLFLFKKPQAAFLGHSGWEKRHWNSQSNGVTLQ